MQQHHVAKKQHAVDISAKPLYDYIMNFDKEL